MTDWLSRFESALPHTRRPKPLPRAKARSPSQPRSRNPLSKAPPDIVLKRYDKEKAHMRRLRERDDAEIVALCAEHRPLARWLSLLHAEKHADLLRQGCVDWDVRHAVQVLGLASTPEKVRRIALKQWLRYIIRIQKKRMDRDEDWYGDPLPKAMGGWRTDTDRVRRALGLT